MISQVKGLAENFSNNILKIDVKLIFPWSVVQPGILPIFPLIFLNKFDFNNKPNIVISCGRKSVYLSLFLKKKIKNVITIHIQNPKINFKYFDFVIAPKHDSISGKNVIKSTGALHKFNYKNIDIIKKENFQYPDKNLVSIIIGGDNNHYKFGQIEIEKFIEQIKNLIKNHPDKNFLIITSRRTNLTLKKKLDEGLNKISSIWIGIGVNPYVFALKYSEYFIVTSDSTSMISECAFTGKPIYIYNLPFKRTSKRIEKFHTEFINLNITKKFDTNSKLQIWDYKILNESERIASIIKQKIIKEVE